MKTKTEFGGAVRVDRSTVRMEIADLATLLARAYLRLAETSRCVAISRADVDRIPLDVSPPESPDHDVEPAKRRAS